MGNNTSSTSNNIDSKDVACEANREDCKCGGAIRDGSDGGSEGGVSEDEEMDGSSSGGGDAFHDIACRPFCNVHRTPPENKPVGRAGVSVQFPTVAGSQQCDEQYCVEAQDGKEFQRTYKTRKMITSIYNKEFPECFYRENAAEEATPILGAGIAKEDSGFDAGIRRVPPQYVDRRSLQAMLSAARTGPYSLAAGEGQMVRCFSGAKSIEARGCLAEAWLVLGFLIVGWDRMETCFHMYEDFNKALQETSACTQGDAGYVEAAHAMQMWRCRTEDEWLKFLRSVFYTRRSWEDMAMEEGCCFKHPSAGPCPPPPARFRAPKYPTNKSLREKLQNDLMEWEKVHVGNLVPVHLESAKRDVETMEPGEIDADVQKRPKGRVSTYTLRRK